MTEKELKKIQAMLILLGYDQVIANGKIDKNTHRAIGLFKSKHGLSINFEIDPETFRCIANKVSKKLTSYEVPPRTRTWSPVRRRVEKLSRNFKNYLKKED